MVVRLLGVVQLVVACIAVVVAGSTSPVEAQRPSGDRWTRIASQEIDPAKPSETIDLTKAAGTVKALRVESRRGTIVLSHIDLRYADGSTHTERRDITLKGGERTKPIDQGSKERFIDGMTLILQPDRTAKQKVKLEVFALQSTRGRAEKRPAAPAVAAPSGTVPATGQLAGAPTAGKTEASAGDAVGGAVLFGVQRVGFGRDTDVIRVGAQVGKFDRIRLRVLENDIFINSLKVVYASGDPDVLAVNAQVDRNTRTDWFKLKGDRFIQEIQLTYRSKPSVQGQAQVEVYGEFAEGWLGPKGEAARFNQGWVLLGANTVSGLFEKDVIEVARNRGGFKQIRVLVKERGIFFREMRIAYATGKEDVIPIKARVDAGAIWGPVAVAAGDRGIKEIQTNYRPIVFDKKAGSARGTALVEIWGKY